MTRYVTVAPNSPSGLLRIADAERVAAALRTGGLAVLPTETGYLLAALASSREAVLRAFRAKQRDVANPMHVGCSSLAMAQTIAEITPSAERLIATFTPGPLTVVVRKTDALPDALVTLHGTVGVRIPDNAAALQVISALDAPVTATSLNRAGEEAAPVSQALLDQLDWGDLAEVLVVEQPDSAWHRQPSTLVQLTGPAPQILRAGPVSTEDIDRVLAAGAIGAGR